MQRSEVTVGASIESDLGAGCTAEMPTRRERRRAQTRGRIFDAAMCLLAERDFDAVTVEAITEAADVGKGTFFNYFASKEAVVGHFFEEKLALLTESLQVVQEKMDRMESPCASEDPGGPCWRKMMAVLRLVTEQDPQHKRLTRTLLALALTNPEVRQADLSMRERMLEIVQGLVEEAQRGGELRADIDPRTVATHLFHTHFGVLAAWCQSDREDSLLEALRVAYRMVWEGFGQREAASISPPAATCPRSEA